MEQYIGHWERKPSILRNLNQSAVLFQEQTLITYSFAVIYFFQLLFCVYHKYTRFRKAPGTHSQEQGTGKVIFRKCLGNGRGNDKYNACKNSRNFQIFEISLFQIHYYNNIMIINSILYAKLGTEIKNPSMKQNIKMSHNQRLKIIRHNAIKSKSVYYIMNHDRCEISNLKSNDKNTEVSSLKSQQ